MFYLINKLVGAVLSPLGLALLALIVAGGLGIWRRNWKIPAIAGFACVLWLWVWSTNVLTRIIGVPMERGWSIVKAEDAPVCDAIVLLGGGMSASLEVFPYPDMHGAADRVWHAARLYKAGKAPIVIPTGDGDRESTEPLLLDFGVPQEAIVGEYKARNTEENAKFVGKLLSGRGSRPKVLLVTSAWHMKRSLLMYRKYAAELEIIPAPTDFDSTVVCGRPLSFWQFLPAPEDFYRNCCMFKELIGYWGYRILR